MMKKKKNKKRCSYKWMQEGKSIYLHLASFMKDLFYSQPGNFQTPTTRQKKNLESKSPVSYDLHSINGT